MKGKVVRKKLKGVAGEGSTDLCVVFELGGGVKAQYPIRHQFEVEEIEAEYQKLSETYADKKIDSGEANAAIAGLRL